MLTVKDFLGDCMLIVTVHPHTDKEVFLILNIPKKFLSFLKDLF